jgi:Tfp pilus assembly protein FimV
MTGWFEEARRRGEKRLGRLAGDLMANERFMTAVEAALNVKSVLERRIKTLLHTMSVASRLDVDELRTRLEESDRKLRQATKRLEAIQRQVEEANARIAALSTPQEAGAASAEPKRSAAPHSRTEASEPAAPSNGGHSVASAPAPAAEAICLNCGKPFQKKSYNQRYCSAACRSGVSSGA